MTTFTRLTPGVTQHKAEQINTLYDEVERIASALREKAAADITFYVRPDGNDGNSGRANTSGGAFLTPQRAAEAVMSEVDWNGKSGIIQFADGTYSTGLIISRAPLNITSLSILGNVTTPANCKISTTAADCIAIRCEVTVVIEGFQLKVTSGNHNCLQFTNGATAYVGNNVYDVATYCHFDIQYNANVFITDDYSIIGGCSAGYHWHSGTQSYFYADGKTITLTGTPAFGLGFTGVGGGVQDIGGLTFMGNATGKRYVVHKNGTIAAYANKNTYLPGNAAGTEMSGGRYIGNGTYDDLVPDAVVIPSTYTAPTLVNSWVNYGSYATGYYKDQFGIVRLRGTVSTGTIGTVICTLPAGYRPSQPRFFAVVSNSLFGAVMVAANGEVSALTGNNTWVSLDGISFDTAA